MGERICGERREGMVEEVGWERREGKRDVGESWWEKKGGVCGGLRKEGLEEKVRKREKSAWGRKMSERKWSELDGARIGACRGREEEKKRKGGNEDEKGRG